MSEIVLDKITKRFPDGTEAVKQLDLEIADGEFLILVGPSGCGKSTALRMIAGLEDISDGEMRIGGEVVNDRAPKDRDIAMVFQNYALYPHMSVRDNMAPAPSSRRSTRRSRRRRGSSTSPSTSTASRRTSPAVSASGSRWAGRSSATRRPS
jgi:ABC-type sugar transport system ATPase subunit